MTLTGVDDFVDDGNITYTITTAAASSADGLYDGLDPANVLATNNDDDAAGFTVTPTSGLTTTESGGTATFTVVLNSQPTANVTLALSSSNTAEGTVSPASLNFTAANWNTAQTVTLMGVNDFVDDGNIAYTIVTAAAVSADGSYNGLDPANVSATNTDDDTAGFTVTPTSGLTTTEAGGTATFTLKLNSQPTANVTIGLSSSNTAEGTVSPASLTFTAANWNTAQTVTLTGVNDFVDDGNIGYTITTAAAVSADGSYNGLNPANVSATNTDDDTAGFTVTPTSGLTTTEAGGTATFTLQLNSQPTANVTIGISSSNTAEGTVSPASLTFTAANWNTAQTVTLTGVADLVQDGNVAYTVVTAAAVSADGNYAGLNPDDVSATNNDTPGGVGTLSATLISGTLTVTDFDAAGRNNELVVRMNGSWLEITDAAEQFVSAPPGGTLSNGNKTLSIPLSSITGIIKVDSAGGSDTIAVDYVGGRFFRVIEIAGGSPTTLPGDKLVVKNAFTTVPFVVDTLGGKVDASGDPTLIFSGIEDVDVFDSTLSDVAMGSMYARMTAGPDYVQFVSAAQIDPAFRIRIGNTYYPLSGGNYGPYFTSTTTNHAASQMLVYGGDGNDLLNMYNTRLNAAFFGQAGDDVITGGYGNDLLVGGAGVDRLNGGSVGGNDEIWGDNYNPFVDDPNVASQTVIGGNDQINTYGGSDTVYGQGGNDTINSGAGDDYINGGAGDDLIDGQGGNDRAYGGSGNDVISGSDGNDIVAGNAGNDTLHGQAGNNILIGGIGQDTVNGGGGSDALVGDESNQGGSNSTSRNDAVDAALLALMALWGPTPTLTSLGAFNSAGSDNSVDTLWGGAEADAFFGAPLDNAADRNASDLN